MQLKTRSLIPFLAIAVTACIDRGSGIMTYAETPMKIDADCIDTALKHALGGGGFKRLGSTDPNLVDWDYDYGGKLAIQRTGKLTKYWNGNFGMGPDHPVDGFRPLMQKVNTAVEADCGLPLSRIATIKHVP